MNLIGDAFWFFLPAGLANMAPVLANYIPVLNRWKTPLDFGKKYRGKRLLGNNKTWRGLLFGVLVAGLAGFVQYKVILETDISVIVVCSMTAMMGFGALFGDAVESLCKRQRGIASGRSWFPFDQIDYIIGGLVFIYPLVGLAPSFMATIFIMYFGLHLMMSYVGYLIGVKKSPI